MYSKTTFVTVNHWLANTLRMVYQNSKTTFVTVNQFFHIFKRTTPIIQKQRLLLLIKSWF